MAPVPYRKQGSIPNVSLTPRCWDRHWCGSSQAMGSRSLRGALTFYHSPSPSMAHLQPLPHAVPQHLQQPIIQMRYWLDWAQLDVH